MTVSQRCRWLWIRGYWARRRHLRSMPSKPGVYMGELRPVSGTLELKRQQKDLRGHTTAAKDCRKDQSG